MSSSHVTAGAPPLITDRGAPRPPVAPRLILLDLDGTCIEGGNEPPPRTPAAIRRAVAGGLTVTIATGRAYHSVLPWALKLGVVGPLICGQGAVIREMPGSNSQEPGRILFHHPIGAATASAAVRFARERRWPFIVDHGLELFTEAGVWPRAQVPPRHDALTVVDDATLITATDSDRVVMVLRDRSEAETNEAERLLRTAFGDRAEIVRSTPGFIEVTDRSATKGQALHRLAGHLGVDPAATLAVGDGYNDLDMLEEAGFSVGIEGSVEAVLARVDCLCAGPRAAGVADVLEVLGLA